VPNKQKKLVWKTNKMLFAWLFLSIFRRSSTIWVYIYVFIRSEILVILCHLFTVLVFYLLISAKCNIYILRSCYDVSDRLSLTEVHWHIIANLGFKFRSQFTTHCSRGVCRREHSTIYNSVGARAGIIAGKSGGIISRYASHC